MCCIFSQLKCLAHKRFKTDNSFSLWNNPLFEDPTNRTSNNFLFEGSANLSAIADSDDQSWCKSVADDNGHAMHATAFYLADRNLSSENGVQEAKETDVAASVVMHHETRRFRTPQMMFLDFLFERFAPVWLKKFDHGLEVEFLTKDRFVTLICICDNGVLFGTIDFVESVFQAPFSVIISLWYTASLVIVPCKIECDLSVPWIGSYFLSLQEGKLSTQTNTYVLGGCMDTYVETSCPQGWCLGHNRSCCFRLTVELVFHKVTRLLPQNDPRTKGIICVEMDVLRFEPKCTVVRMKVDYLWTFEARELWDIINTENIDHCHVPLLTGFILQARNDDDIILISDSSTNNSRVQDKATVSLQGASLAEEDINSKITAASKLDKVTTQGYGVSPNRIRTNARAVGKRKREPSQEESEDDEQGRGHKQVNNKVKGEMSQAPIIIL